MVKETHNGCRLLMPAFPARAPVRKGSTAEPAWPKPAIQPIDPLRSHGGRVRDVWFMTMG